MNIVIIYKKDKVKDPAVVPALVEGFEKHGHNVRVAYSGAELRDADCAVVLGGDGALLHVAILAGKKRIKVLGINFGTLGFLSEFEASEARKSIDLVCGKHGILSRTMLRVHLDGKEFYALNEVVLQRDYSGIYKNQVAEIGVLINGKKATDYILDGLAIATPTGSTAYSLSAGGSILAPEVRAFILTPICSLRLSARPLIISDESKISFDLAKQKDPMYLYADGKQIGKITQESKLYIEKSPWRVDFITRDKERFFEVLNKKLTR